MRRYIRTCQSCGYELSASTETKDKSTKSYRFRKCPKCRAEDFDWGSWRGYDTKPWRDRFKALTGHDLITPEARLDELIYDNEDTYLAEDSPFLQVLKENNF